jgi:putative FmdB family regulatory protein
VPIYEYQCARCDAVFEFIEGLSEAEESRPCNACGSSRMTRMLSRGERILADRDGNTCCGLAERCDRPPCGRGGTCLR